MKKKIVRQKVKRFNLELPQKAYDRAKEIEQMTESASLSEVLRRALILYSYAVTAESEGKKLVIRDGDLEQELLLLN